jgi:hypothetical protein
MRTVFSALFVLFFGFYFSQEIKPLDTIKTEKQVVEDIEKPMQSITKYNPTKAGLYSAVLPVLAVLQQKILENSHCLGRYRNWSRRNCL